MTSVTETVPVAPTLVLGIGNLLWGDEAFGVRALEAFHRAYVTPPEIELLDGGTQGLYLVQYVTAAEQLLLFDAIDYGLPPGTLRVIEDDEVPKFTGAKKMSLHQTGFQEVLSAADLLGRYPRRLTLIGCQPLDLENWGGPLTDPVRAALEPAVETAARVLTGWGIPLARRAPDDEAALLGHDLDAARFERAAAGL